MVNEETKKHYLSITPSPELRDRICQPSPSQRNPAKKRNPMLRGLALSTCAAALFLVMILHGVGTPSEILLLTNGTTIGSNAVVVSQETAVAHMTLPREMGDTLIIPLSLQGGDKAELHASTGEIQPSAAPQAAALLPQQEEPQAPPESQAPQEFVWVLKNLQPNTLPTLTVRQGTTQIVYSLSCDSETGVWYIKQESTP